MTFELMNKFINVAEAAQGGELQDIVWDISQAFSAESITITVIGYTVVFAALWFLSIFVFYMGKVLTKKQRTRLKETGVEVKEDEDLKYAGEVNAAIAMALSIHLGEIHDDESGLLTINQIARKYSPWSSKLYNLREEPIKTSGLRK